MRKYRNKDWLEKKYVEEGLFGTEIAKICDVHFTTIYDWLRKLDIPVQQRGKRPNHVKLTDELCEFLDGMLLGDGNIHPRHEGAAYQHRDKHIEYLEWLSEKMKEYGLSQSGEIHMYNSGHYKTKDYVELSEFYQRWYDDEGNKIIPKDIDLTPTVLMNWYVGDGSRKEDDSVYLLAIKEEIRENLPLVTDILEEIGVESTINSQGIRIKNKSLNRFFDYILSNGMEIPPCYEYKFPEEVIN